MKRRLAVTSRQDVIFSLHKIKEIKHTAQMDVSSLSCVSGSLFEAEGGSGAAVKSFLKV